MPLSTNLVPATSGPLAQAPERSSQAFLSARAAPRGLALYLALLAPILLLALGMRLVSLGTYSGLFDEGIRAEQLFLMAQDYRPFKEIFAAQGPLLLDAWYPFYRLFGAIVPVPLVAVRLVAVTYSLIGLIGIGWIGHQLAGRAGGLAAALALALSPLYLEGSRLALAEVPALAPAILALGCAVRYRKVGALRWLVGAGLLLTLSLLMKPITFAVAPAVALAALLRPAQVERGLLRLALVSLAMLALSGLILWLLGFAEVREQILAYRQASRDAEGWSLRKNVLALQAGLAFEPAALLPLSGLGGLALLAADGRRALPAIVWTLGGLALLLAYSPLHGKHIVVLVPSLTLLVGAGFARAWQARRQLQAARARLLAAAPLVLAALWYVLTLLPLLGQTGQLLRVTSDTDVDPAFEQYADAASALRALTGPNDFIVTDQPYLAFLAERKVPPELVDTALARIRSRSLTGARAQSIAEAYTPPVVLLWGDRLRQLATFKSWVESEYQVVKVYNRRGDTDRSLYLRRGQDFAAARLLLGQKSLGGPSADFGGELRLAGASLDRTALSIGQGANLTMVWEQLARSPIDYHVLIALRGADGRGLDEQEESLGGGSTGTSQWEPGHWLVQGTFVQSVSTPGVYTVAVAVYDSRARVTVPIDGQAESRELTVGTLTVR